VKKFNEAKDIAYNLMLPHSH